MKSLKRILVMSAVAAMMAGSAFAQSGSGGGSSAPVDGTDGAGGTITAGAAAISGAVTNNIGIAVPISVLLLGAAIGWRALKRLAAK